MQACPRYECGRAQRGVAGPPEGRASGSSGRCPHPEEAEADPEANNHHDSLPKIQSARPAHLASFAREWQGLCSLHPSWDAPPPDPRPYAVSQLPMGKTLPPGTLGGEGNRRTILPFNTVTGRDMPSGDAAGMLSAGPTSAV